MSQSLTQEEVDIIAASPKTTLAARYSYMVLGINYAVWAAIVPYTKMRLAIDESTLGILLLCVGLGGVLSMPFAGKLSERFGCRPVLSAFLALSLISLLSLPYVPSVWGMAIMLSCFGITLGILDVVLNVQAFAIEDVLKCNMTSTLYGMYNIGCIAGAGCMSLLLMAGLSSSLAVTLIALTALVPLFTFCMRHFVPTLPQKGKKSGGFVKPPLLIVLLGLICFVSFLSDGSVLGWSALFLVQDRGADAEWASMSFAAYAGAVTLCRLVGGWLMQRFGMRSVLIWGAFIGIIGFAIVCFSTNVWLVFVGFFVAGLGIANMSPILFSWTGHQTVMPVSVALPMVTTIGYAGLLLGPAIMGVLAQASSIVAVFISLIVLLASSMMLARKL